MLQINDVHLKRGHKSLFEGLDLTVHAGARVGIVGRNGCGKSTLFALIRQRLQPEAGEVKLPSSWTIAWLAQETEVSDRSAMDWTLDGDQGLRRVQQAIAEAEAADDNERLAQLYGDLENHDGYTAEARAGTVLHGLGFDSSDFARSVSDFSGGWRIRLNLARTLMTPAELLLLDEPTNHLDVDATLWLENWLKRFAGTALVVSHDREFLDGVATHIAHMTARRLTLRRGNYSSFETQRTEQLTRDQSVFDKQRRREQEIRDFVNRFRAKASKAKQAQSRMKALQRMTASAPVHADAPYQFQFPNPRRMSTPLLALHQAACGYPDRTVLEAVELRIYPGSRIGLLGRNGAGKSTLIRSICADIPLLGGDRLPGDHCSIGYFAQHTVDMLNLEQHGLWHLAQIEPNVRDQDLRTFLGGWGFTGEAALQPTATLSGGEKARLALACLAFARPALLLLDEPTNHLDLDMRAALVIALQAYEGAVMVVSHDRALLRACVDEFLLVARHTVDSWDGDLDDYARWLLKKDRNRDLPTALDAPDHPDSQAAPSPQDTAGTKAPQSAPAVDRREQRRQQADARGRAQPLRKEIQTLEKRIHKLETELDQIDVRLADPTLYDEPHQNQSRGEVQELTQRQGQLRRDKDTAEERWLELSDQLEAHP